MDGFAHPESGLTKALWDEVDFALMGWHDATVHAMAVLDHDEGGDVPMLRVLLDIDYIVAWVAPAGRAEGYTFWVAPATLVFAPAWNLAGELSPAVEPLQIMDVHRLPPPDATGFPLWRVEGDTFDLRLRSHGYRQYFRRPPRHVARQALTQAERGGPDFAERAFR